MLKNLAIERSKRLIHNYLRLRFILFFLLQVVAISTIGAQAPRWLQDDSLSVMFGWKNTELLETDSLERWVVIPAHYVAGFRLRRDQVEELNGWDSKKWLSYLKHRKTGYITNWLLYALTERDATLEKDIAEDSWGKSDREREITFWRNFLRENTVPNANILSQ